MYMKTNVWRMQSVRKDVLILKNKSGEKESKLKSGLHSIVQQHERLQVVGMHEFPKHCQKSKSKCSNFPIH